MVERSGQSLRSFYQYFGGKHELLLALFEESVRSTAEHLRDEVGRGERRRSSGCTASWSSTTASAGRPADGQVGARTAARRGMVEFAQQLLTAHPPKRPGPSPRWSRLFEEVLDEAADGRRRPVRTCDHRRDRRRGARGDHVQRLLDHHRRRRQAGTGADAAEELWDLVFHGIGSPDR